MLNLMSTIMPCKLCSARLQKVVKTHTQRLHDFERRKKMELYVQKRQLLRLKYHLNNSSESQHQLDANVIFRKTSPVAAPHRDEVASK